MSPTAIIVFARFPHPGRVKTRLARTIGDEQAARMYRVCSEHIFAELGKLGTEIQRLVFYADDSDDDAIRAWVPEGYPCVPQRGITLGERMSHAFAYAFEAGFQHVFLVGTDVPDISSVLIKQAIDDLKSTDAVIGPSHDGGYYLLGLKRSSPELFAGVPWSGDQVLARTLHNIHQLELSCILLPELIDIDTEEDLRRWYRSAKEVSDHRLFELMNDAQLSMTREFL